MIIPKGKPVHKELSSYFVDLGKLLEELKGNSFSGFIEMVGVKHEGEILLEGGAVANVRIRGDVNLLGRQHLGAILQIGRKENLLISTYQLPPEAVFFISRYLGSEKIHENISSEFTDPKKLLSRLENDPNDHFVEVVFQKNIGYGLLFVQEGQPVDALISLLGKDLIAGETAIKEIIDGSRDLGATFNVYRSTAQEAEPTPSEVEISRDEIQAVMEALLNEFRKDFPADNKRGLEFNHLFQESCLELADKFPFLDPFAALRRGSALAVLV
ncbi:MAG TPA: hypothetical protein PK636_06660, partial [bacterium]|nr:hypothetical protein [bacterium]